MGWTDAEWEEETARVSRIMACRGHNCGATVKFGGKVFSGNSLRAAQDEALEDWIASWPREVRLEADAG